MSKPSLASISLLAGVAAVAVGLFYYQQIQPPYTPPSIPVETPEQIARKKAIEQLYPPYALKDPFEFAYPKKKGLVTYGIINAINGEMRNFLSAVEEHKDEDFLSPVRMKKDPSDPPANYFEKWGIKLFGKGNLYRKIALYGSEGFDIMNEHPKSFLYFRDSSHYSDYVLKESLELDDPTSWYYYAYYLFKTRRADDPITPFQAMKKAADLGSPEAQLWVGDVYCLGVDTRNPDDLNPARGFKCEPVEINPELAMKYRQMALDNGERDALYHIAMSYYHGTCLPQNKKLAFAYLHADGSSPLVQRELFDSLTREEREEALRKARGLWYKVR